MFCLGVTVKEIGFCTGLDDATIDYHLASEQKKRRLPDREALRRSVLREQVKRGDGNLLFPKKVAWDEKARDGVLAILMERAARLKVQRKRTTATTQT